MNPTYSDRGIQNFKDYVGSRLVKISSHKIDSKSILNQTTNADIA